MLVVSNTVIFLGLIARTATALARSDRERKAAEEAVGDREAYLAITLDSIGDAVIADSVKSRTCSSRVTAGRASCTI
jgi:hypothetical protein